MRRTRANVALFILLAVSAAVAKDQPKAKQPPQTSAALWSDPGDISSRNLFYGSGGERDQIRARRFGFAEFNFAKIAAGLARFSAAFGRITISGRSGERGGDPGREVEFDPEEAERIAFREDALSDEDARESAADL